MKKVAVIEGGFSAEKEISIKSAKTIFDNLDKRKFDPTRVLIEEKEWIAYDEDGGYSIDKNDFSYTKNGSKQV
jgi:D-alanine-D-alanine ligase